MNNTLRPAYSKSMTFCTRKLGRKHYFIDMQGQQTEGMQQQAPRAES